MIRHALIAATLIAATGTSAGAQTREPRVTVSGLIQQEVVAIDEGEGAFTAIGGGVDVRLARYFSVHGELTAGSGEVNDSSEVIINGSPVSRLRTWTPGLGGAALVSFHTPASQQVGVIASAGVAFRDIDLTDMTTDMVVLSSSWRSGLVLGVAVPVRLTERFAIAPDLRWQQGLGDERYRVATIGMRASWRF